MSFPSLCVSLSPVPVLAINTWEKSWKNFGEINLFFLFLVKLYKIVSWYFHKSGGKMAKVKSVVARVFVRCASICQVTPPRKKGEPETKFPLHHSNEDSCFLFPVVCWIVRQCTGLKLGQTDAHSCSVAKIPGKSYSVSNGPLTHLKSAHNGTSANCWQTFLRLLYQVTPYPGA